MLLAQPAPDTLWTRVIGGTGDDLPSAIRQTSDGGYIIAGSTTSFGAIGGDVLLIKLDSTGATEWERRYGGDRSERATDVREVHSGVGGYIALIYKGPNPGTVDLLRLSTTGDSIWVQNVAGGSGTEDTYPLGVTESADGFFTAYRGSNNSGQFISRSCLAYWDTARNHTCEWRECSVHTVSNVDEYCRLWGGIDQSPAGRTFLSGRYYGRYVYPPQPPVRWDFWTIACYASQSQPLWSFTADGNGAMGSAIAAAPDGGCLVAVSNGTVHRFDSTGQELWVNSGLGWIQDLCFSPPGNYVTAGDIAVFGPDIQLRSYNTAGALLWQRTFGGSGREHLMALEATSDSGYVILGSTTSYGAGGTDIYIIKTDPHHWVSADKPEPIPPQSFALSAYPNPFNAKTTLNFSLPKTGSVTVKIYDLNGRVVQVLHDGLLEAGDHRFQVDGGELASGIYFSRVVTAGITATKKLVLLK
jgi:hypothetical protein